MPPLVDDDYLYHSSDNNSQESNSSSFQTDSDYLPHLSSQHQEYTAGTSITSVTSHQSDITVPKDKYDQLGDVSYSLHMINQTGIQMVTLMRSLDP